MTRLFVSDLDGTLLRGDQSLSKKTIHYLKSFISEGMLFTFATARSITASKLFLDETGIKLPVILYNGAQIYCPVKQDYIHTSYLEPKTCIPIMTAYLQKGLNPIVHCVDNNGQLRVFLTDESIYALKGG